jgi:SpoVK/Ycf46/Vps4 family AAA+-type ATPase
VRQLRKLGVAVKVTLADVGGADHALQQLRENIELPMRKPKVFSTLGVAPPIGSLMYGPSGCGKTLIARALGNELNLHVVTVDAPALVTDLLGESELVLRAAFAEAEKNQPALVFIEQLDAVAPKRGRDSGMRCTPGGCRPARPRTTATAALHGPRSACVCSRRLVASTRSTRRCAEQAVLNVRSACGVPTPRDGLRCCR